MARIGHSQRVATFGAPCQSANIVKVDTPWGLAVSAHEDVADVFRAACRKAAAESSWVPRRIDSYNCRKIRGSSIDSLHAWPLAWDFFDRPYPQPVDVWGSANAPDAAFRAAFKSFGFTAGADFSGRKDYPHIEWAAGRPDSVPTEVIEGIAMATEAQMAAIHSWMVGQWKLTEQKAEEDRLRHEEQRSWAVGQWKLTERLEGKIDQLLQQ